MQRYTKYLPLRPRKRPRKLIYGLIALLVVGLGGWIWRQRSKSPATGPITKPNEAPGQRVATRQPPTAHTSLPAPLMVVTSAPPMAAARTNQPPPEPPFSPRPVQNVFEAQLALARLGISSGSLDGVFGLQTRAALSAFQQREGIPVIGALDAATQMRLVLASPPFTNYVVTTNDLARLQPLSDTWLGKSQQTALEYETLLELVAEKAQSHPNLIRRLNPQLDWTNLVAGTAVRVPNVERPPARGRAAFALIFVSAKTLEAFDENTNLLAHFPCSIARRVEKRPVGEALHVEVVAQNPNYTFDPDVFPESAEARKLKRKLVLPPGPNNPVGVAWIGLDKPGYGIHGTPRPEEVGRTESHGCFRLANWNAEHLLRLIWIGMPVLVEP